MESQMEKSQIELVISSRERDLGGFSVRRLLPYATHRMVGPFIFFDHMGPAEFSPGQGMDVRPHPHINLATVTYLFEGCIHHRDCLGSDQVIEPGAINWMTAGCGIVHSERTPDDKRASGMKMNGIQLWVALPAEKEEQAPRFEHHPKSSFPKFEYEGATLSVLLGEVYGKQSPVAVDSPLFYVEADLIKGNSISNPQGAGREVAFYVASGEVECEDKTYGAYTMIIAKPDGTLRVTALSDAKLMIIGGDPVGTRFMYWNLVSSNEDRIEEAKKDWAAGPRAESQRFHKIPGDDHEFIPLPD